MKMTARKIPTKTATETTNFFMLLSSFEPRDVIEFLSMAPSSYGKIWMTESSLFQLPQVVSGHAAKPHAKRRERRELKNETPTAPALPSMERLHRARTKNR